MKYFAPLFLIALFSLSLSAQIATPAATPPDETVEAWRIFAPVGEQFSLEVPSEISLGFVPSDAPLLPSDSGITTPPAALPTAPDSSKSRSYLTVANGNYYFMFSDPVAKPFLNRTAYAFAEAQAPGIKPNEIYGFNDMFGYHHKILIVESGDRIYTFQTVSRIKDSQSAKRFFDTIRIKDVRLQSKENIVLQNIPAEKVVGLTRCSPPPPPPLPAPSLPGNGVGNISSETPIAPPAPPVKTTAIKIISKPRPNYTDYARFYQVTGAVQLRVTFMASGKVSAISVVKGLPFGLTEQSKSAACEMQFEPAIRNDIPITVTKQVVYNFILY